MEFFAHSLPPTHPVSAWEKLAVHLREVGEGASGRAAAALGLGHPLVAAARAAGLLHDLGKYRHEFQEYIRGRRPKGDPDTYHKEAGAARAFVGKNLPVAFAIAGHHGGMPDPTELKQAVAGPSGKPVADGVWGTATNANECPDLQNVPLGVPAFASPTDCDLFTRVLFSCLVDADWTATGEFERRAHLRPAEPEPPPLDPKDRLGRVLNFIDERAKQVGATAVGKVRADILAACLETAACNPGVFTLTVPTGGGKTLAGLAFALKHAEAHGLRRVIYVAPYLSIIEQNADVIRKALGVAATAPDVFEHHSLADPPGDDADEKAREAAARRAENWDAPVVVTTNVQFFESLFSNKPGRCRKLHNVARAVILLDECQALPPGLVAPTCGMLKQLAAPVGAGGLGCSVVLCTATQPAFDHEKLGPDRVGATEIIPSHLDLFNRLKRVELVWPAGNERWAWAEVAARMLNEPRRSALCVVNTKKAARAVFDELKGRGAEGVFHLSTAMCPAHRLAKLHQVRRLLALGVPCYLVSTQLIEAGVDIDFPFVMRELAPFDSVIQAAGRCNREGRLRDEHGGMRYGRVEVFRSQDGGMPPDEWYHKGRAVLEADFLNDGVRPQIDRPEDIRSYYRKLFRTGNLDKHSIQAKRVEDKYQTVAADYRLIKDDTEPVVVETWDSHREEIAALLGEISRTPRKAVFRHLGLYQVNVLRSDLLGKLQPHVRQGPAEMWIWTSRYDETVGIVPEIAWDAIV